MNREKLYEKILERIYAGLYEQAADDIRQLREESSFTWNADLTLMQNLLAARIALKSGNIPASVESLQIGSGTNAFLGGEVCLVKGIVAYQSGHMLEGMQNYSLAKDYFSKSGHKDKELLAWYNNLIGDTHITERPLQEALQMFRPLESQAERFSQQRILGLVRRQKSYFYKEQSKYNAALLEAERGLSALELSCATSDYHLGLLNICEILLELQRPLDAEKYFEMILFPLDKRVQFPFAFIESRLRNKKIDLSCQEQSCPHFLYRFNRWNKLVNEKSPANGSIMDEEDSLIIKEIDDDSIEIVFNKTSHVMKKSVLEFKLIENLAIGPHPKSLLCEKLWPEYSDIEHLDNRLHRLVSRINKKIDGLILYEDKRYKLCGT
ncbi:MAG: hypothetical protein ACXVCY_06520 [Pseudobdellovibrionaceae bacterium]